METDRDPRTGPGAGYYATLVLALLASIAYTVAAIFLNGGCDRPTASTRDDGIRSLVVGAAVMAAPWVLVMFQSRRLRWASLWAAFLVVLVPVVGVLTHLQVGDWSGGFCLVF